MLGITYHGWSSINFSSARKHRTIEVPILRAHSLAILRADNSQAPRVRSWERVRPVGLRPEQGVLAPDPPRIRHAPPRLPSPGFAPRRPRHGPDPPLSPTATTSTASSTQVSGRSSSDETHWVVTAFEQSRPTTLFRTTGTE